MPVVIPEDHYQLSLHHTLVGSTQEGVVTMGFRHDSGVFLVDAAQVEVSWRDDVIAQMNQSWAFTRAVWRVQEGAVRDLPYSEVGTGAAPGEPPMVAVLVRKVTGQPGRYNRGRMYLPGISEDGVDPLGFLASGYLDGWQAVLDTWMDQIAANNFTPMLLHNLDSPVTTPTEIIGLQVQTRVATQRRRNR